ncbi:MAG: Crp/Fnr family transcriptional regulator [Bacteroidetes bacterium]|nr:Crp/Fnr family transcriptional regulator [Bacteroidota bacterium]
MTETCQSTNCADCNRKLSLFQSLTDGQLDKINESRFEIRFGAGETLLKQGGPLTHIVCLTKGLVKIHIENHGGSCFIMSVVKPMTLIIGPGFLRDNRHHYTVTALTESSACFIQVESFKKVLEENSQFALDMIAFINKKIIRHYQNIGNLAHKHMQGKLAETLIYLSEDVFQSQEFKSNLSRQDLAELTGLTKESVIRVLKEWKEEGIVDSNSDYFKILNKDSLFKIGRNG